MIDFQQRSIRKKDNRYSERDLYTIEGTTDRSLKKLNKMIETDVNGDVWITVSTAQFKTVLTPEMIGFINGFYNLVIKAGATLREVILPSFADESVNNKVTFKTGIYNKDSEGNYWRQKETSDVEMAFYLQMFTENPNNFKAYNE